MTFNILTQSQIWLCGQIVYEYGTWNMESGIQRSGSEKGWWLMTSCRLLKGDSRIRPTGGEPSWDRSETSFVETLKCLTIFQSVCFPILWHMIYLIILYHMKIKALIKNNIPGCVIILVFYHIKSKLPRSHGVSPNDERIVPGLLFDVVEHHACVVH